MQGRKKCLVDSTSREHVQSGLMQFSKLCLNLCLFMWLKSNLNLESNFKPKGWRILYIKSGVGRPSLSEVFLNFLEDSDIFRGLRKRSFAWNGLIFFKSIFSPRQPIDLQWKSVYWFLETYRTKYSRMDQFYLVHSWIIGSIVP